MNLKCLNRKLKQRVLKWWLLGSSCKISMNKLWWNSCSLFSFSFLLPWPDVGQGFLYYYARIDRTQIWRPISRGEMIHLYRDETWRGVPFGMGHGSVRESTSHVDVVSVWGDAGCDVAGVQSIPYQQVKIKSIFYNLAEAMEDDEGYVEY